MAATVCMLTLFLTSSRGGLVALGVALIAAVVLGGRRRGTMLVAAFGAVLVTVFYFATIAPTDVRERVTHPEGGTGRVDIWTVGWRMVEHNTIHGVGSGNFSTSSIHYLLEPGVIMRDDFIVSTPKVAHNTYLQILAELGVVGFALFLTILGFSLVCASKAHRVAARGRRPRAGHHRSGDRGGAGRALLRLHLRLARLRQAALAAAGALPGDARDRQARAPVAAQRGGPGTRLAFAGEHTGAGAARLEAVVPLRAELRLGDDVADAL